MTACNSIVFELHHWGHLAELLGFDHKLAVHAELLGCVLQRLLVLSFTCPLTRALGLCITETHSRTSCQPYGEHAVGCRKAPLCTRLGPIWASATGATETFSSSDLRSTASGALEKRWRPCSCRKTTSKDVRCTPTRWAASFFSLAACPELLLRRRTHWGSEIGLCFRKLRGTTDTELVLHVATFVLPGCLRGRPLRPANRLR